MTPPLHQGSLFLTHPGLSAKRDSAWPVRARDGLLAMDIIPAQPGDGPEIEALLDAAFGPDRLRRTAQRLRDGATPLPGLSMAARDGGRLEGSIQYWPIELADGGETHPLVLLGPVAVAADARKIGLGRRLIGASLAAADAAGHDAILLIGDVEYYGQFGFDARGTAEWEMPGPVERHRLLLRRTGARTLPASGIVRAAGTTRRLAA